MGDTSIEWTDKTWNPVTGCSKVSPGCKNCWAKKIHDRRHKAFLSGKAMPSQYSRPFEEVQVHHSRLDQPLRWRKPLKIAVCLGGDLFHEMVPDEFIDEVFAVMALCPQHTFQVLTKRAARMLAYFTAPGLRNRIAFALRA